MWECLQHINACFFDLVKAVLWGTWFLLKYISALSFCFPVHTHFAFKKPSLRGGSTFWSHSLSFSVLFFFCFSMCYLHHFAHFHIISSSSQIAVALGNCICWSDLAWLTPPPQKYGDVRVMLAWAQPSWADWVILPVTEQDNHISKYSPLLSPSPPSTTTWGSAAFHTHWGILWIHFQFCLECLKAQISTCTIFCPYSLIDPFSILDMKDAHKNTFLI